MPAHFGFGTFHPFALLLLVTGLLTALLMPIVRSSGAVSAQGGFDAVVNVENGAGLGYLVWSFDNRTLAFFNRGLVDEPITPSVNLERPAWQTYDVATEVLSAGQTRFPLQPDLDPAELALFQPREYVLPSPDGTLLAFTASDVNNDNPYPLMFANRWTHEVFKTSLRTYGDPLVYGGGLSGYWSEQGNAFIYPRASLFTTDVLYYHIRVNANDPQSSIVRPFSPIIDGVEYLMVDGMLERVWDMSSSGDAVLSTARKNTISDNEPAGGQQPFLVVWVPENPTSSYRIPIVEGENIHNASFTPDDRGITLLLNDGRVLVYRIDTQDVLELPLTLFSDYPFLSAFSPNGEWLAVIDLYNDRLGFFDVARAIAQTPTPLMPPVAVAGADQELVDTDGDGMGEVTVSGDMSDDPDGQVIRYVWSHGNAKYSAGAVQTLRIPLGISTFTLTVTDNDGLQSVDEVAIILDPLPDTSTATNTPTPTPTATPSVGTVQLSGVPAVVALPA